MRNNRGFHSVTSTILAHVRLGVSIKNLTSQRRPNPAVIEKQGEHTECSSNHIRRYTTVIVAACCILPSLVAGQKFAQRSRLCADMVNGMHSTSFSN